MQLLSSDAKTGKVRVTGGFAGDRDATPDDIANLVKAGALDKSFLLAPTEAAPVQPSAPVAASIPDAPKTVTGPG